jgi:two-component system, LytTR family, sensor kinase
VAIVTHAYETVFLLHDWESDRLRSARLEQQRLEAELESLRREVDPHFLFNNLNALAHLVEEGSVKAPSFIQALGATYRYLLDVRGRPLVPLAEEIEALQGHLLLTNIRYGGAIVLTVDVPGEAGQIFRLPPVTLSELLQNAVKHNKVSQDSPLSIRMHVEDDTLVFGNELRRRGPTQRSTGVGLRNLSARFTLATGRDLEWREAGNRFEVRLPLVRSPSSSAPRRTVAGVDL